MGSSPEDLKLLQKQSEQRKQQDYINTNILQSDDPELRIAQDMIIGFAASNAVESVTIDLLKDGLVNAINKRVAIAIPVKGGRKLLLGKKAIEKAIATAEKKTVTIAQNSAKVINKFKSFQSIAKGVKAALALKNTGKTAAEAVKIGIKTTEKAGVKLAEKAGVKLAEKAAVKIGVKAAEVMTEAAMKGVMEFGTICAVTGAETAGVGCLVGVAVMVLQLAFDAFNLAMDIIDPNGVSVVIYKPDIEMIAKTTGEWVNKEYSKDKPNYLNEEVFFDWESHLWVFDESDNLTADLELTKQYEKYRDEYMASIGITGDWRSRIPVLDISKPSDPGVLSPLTLTFQEYKKEADAYLKSKKSSSSVLLFAVILFVILFLIFIFFFII